MTQIFDDLLARKVEIEAAFGAELEWKRLNDRKACRIQYVRAFDGYNAESWPANMEWMAGAHPAAREGVRRAAPAGRGSDLHAKARRLMA